MTVDERKAFAHQVRAWHQRKQNERRVAQGSPAWRPITFEELAQAIEGGELEPQEGGHGG